MRRCLVAAVILCSVHISDASAGQITAMEWNRLGQLEVRYFIGNAGSNFDQVSCTAYHDGVPIGGGIGYTIGGVAVVKVDVPNSFKDKQLSVKCQP